MTTRCAPPRRCTDFGRRAQKFSSVRRCFCSAEPRGREKIEAQSSSLQTAAWGVATNESISGARCVGRPEGCRQTIFNWPSKWPHLRCPSSTCCPIGIRDTTRRDLSSRHAAGAALSGMSQFFRPLNRFPFVFNTRYFGNVLRCLKPCLNFLNVI